MKIDFIRMMAGAQTLFGIVVIIFLVGYLVYTKGKLQKHKR